MNITFGLLGRPPLVERAAHGAHVACEQGDLLGCTLATWVAQQLPAGAAVGVLLDCKSDRDNTTTLSTIPAHWLPPHVEPHRIRSRCLYGGVCLSAAAGRSSKRCSVGSRSLLRFLLESFPTTELYIKVDCDTVVLPHRILAWALAQPMAAAMGLDSTRFYAGNTLKLPYFAYCRGVFSHAGSRPANHTCVRSTDGWAQLEASIAGIPNTPERQWMRRLCANPPRGSRFLTGTKPNMRDVSGAERRAAAAATAAKGAPLVPPSVQMRCGGVRYARGGAYLLSRATLAAIVHHDCVSRVAALSCNGWSDSSGDEGACEWNLEHEDAAVGLCAHLVGVGVGSVTSSACFNSLGHRLPDPTQCPWRSVLSSHAVKKSADYLSLWKNLSSLSSDMDEPGNWRLVAGMHATWG
jgi:hypothetical protein